jgi:hypothetical protein
MPNEEVIGFESVFFVLRFSFACPAQLRQPLNFG